MIDPDSEPGVREAPDAVEPAAEDRTSPEVLRAEIARPEDEIARQGCVEPLKSARADTEEEASRVAFYRERLATMKRCFDALDRLVATVLAIDDFRESAFAHWFGGVRRKRSTRP